MKRNILLLVLLLLFGTLGYSQNSTERYISNAPHVATNIERYKKEYELIDESLIVQDNSILNSINLSRLDYNRKPNEDVIYFDKRINLNILIYSEQKIKNLKDQDSNIDPEMDKN